MHPMMSQILKSIIYDIKIYHLYQRKLALKTKIICFVNIQLYKIGEKLLKITSH